MNGLTSILAVFLITVGGTFASHRSGGIWNVASDQSLVETEVSHFDAQTFDGKYSDQFVPAAEFTIGRMTPQSLAVLRWVIYDKSKFSKTPQVLSFYSRQPLIFGTGLTTSMRGHIGQLNQTFTFVEVFDTSADGQSGGLVRFNSGGVGFSEFNITVIPVSPDSSISVYVVAYSLDIINGGNNFRVGRFLPWFDLLQW